MFTHGTPARDSKSQGDVSSACDAWWCSVDGMHAGDLDAFTKAFPNSTMSRLRNSSTNYQNAYLETLSDSFPGTVQIFAGTLLLMAVSGCRPHGCIRDSCGHHLLGLAGAGVLRCQAGQNYQQLH